MQIDPNHTWNDGKPIRSKKQSCGCHITAKKFNLCQRGKDFKKSADSCYGLWQHNKDTPNDPSVIKALRGSFETERDIYLEHLRSGKDWCITDEMATKWMEKGLEELRASGVIGPDKFK